MNKKIITLTILVFSAFFVQAQNWTQIGQDLFGDTGYDHMGCSVGISADGSVIAVGAYANDGGGNDRGQVKIFKNTAGAWGQVGDDIIGENNENFSGYSVSLNNDGNILAIGEPFNNDNGIMSGQVRVFQNIGGTWVQVGSDINGTAPEDLFGSAVSLSNDGTVLAIGAYNNDSNGTNSGHVKVFQNQANVWTQVGSDLVGGGDYYGFGKSISLNGDGTNLCVGAIGGGNNKGLVQVFNFASGNWTQIGSDIEGENNSDSFGVSVSISDDGSVFAAGAYTNEGNGPGSGQVRVYENFAGNWTQIGSDIDGEEEYDYFGSSVSLNSSGDILAAGAYGNDFSGDQAGNARVFQYQGGSWLQIANSISGDAPQDSFGNSLCLNSSGTTLVVGAIDNSAYNIYAGQVQVFSYNTSVDATPYTYQHFSVFPNPTSDFINIIAEADINSVVITDMCGKTVLNESINIFKGDYFKADISDLEKGIYFVSISNDMDPCVVKFIKK
ncbi:MAG: T9SS type A sorting domain-containing protein [Bacteroidales bacterium]|nr:T9SS type A sorting domain-containing protein [Bacteroidales bacterium]